MVADLIDLIMKSSEDGPRFIVMPRNVSGQPIIQLTEGSNPTNMSMNLVFGPIGNRVLGLLQLGGYPSIR